MIILECPHCGKQLGISEKYAGKVGKCTGCGATVEVPALPGTNQPPVNPSVTTSRAWFFLSLVLIGVLVCVFTGLGVYVLANRNKTARGIESPSEQAERASEQAKKAIARAFLPPMVPSQMLGPAKIDQPPPQKVFSVGEDASYAGKTIHVYSLGNWQNPGRYASQPAQGNVFIALDVGMKNNGDTSMTTNPFSFYALDEEGRQYTHGFSLTPPQPSLGARNIGKGEKARGWICLEVPSNAKELILVYEINSFTGESIRVRLV